MLLFSATLDVKKHVTKRDFIDLAIKWNDENLREANRVPGVTWDESAEAHFGNERLWLEIKDHAEKDLVAIRHEKVTEDGAIWDTDYVLDLSEHKVSIRLDRSYVEEALRVDAQFSAPHFITLLIESEFLEDDGCLPVRRRPTLVDSLQKDALRAVASGEQSFKMPIVYISKKESGEYPVDAGLLSSKLKGVSHVFIQGEEPLELSCGGSTLGLGDIAIFFPSAQADDTVVPLCNADGNDADGGQAMFDAVLRLVVQYSNTLQVSSLQTWEGVSSDQLLQKMSARVHNAEQSNLEANALLEISEEDYSVLQKVVTDLNGRISALEAENASLRGRLGYAGAPLLRMGVEGDTYPGEIKDLVLDTLEKASRNCAKGRRQDVLLDVVQSNDFQRTTRDKAEQLRALLKNADPTSERFVSGMEKLGFKITTGKKHNKAKYNGEDRYAVTFAKTPSDFRAASNSASVFTDIAF